MKIATAREGRSASARALLLRGADQLSRCQVQRLNLTPARAWGGRQLFHGTVFRGLATRARVGRTVRTWSSVNVIY